MDHEQTSDAATTATEAIHSGREGAALDAAERAEIVDELLIEEISIDGMCGVY